ncbi:MAG: isochorismate synthase [bacterium]|nr:isochorismate synthase [bacterium]
MAKSRDNLPHPIQTAGKILAEKLRTLSIPAPIQSAGNADAAQTPQQGDDSLPVIRLEIEIEKTDLTAWLAAQQADVKTYFSSRDAGDREIAGIGVTDCFYLAETTEYKKAFGHMRKHLSAQSPDLRYYGAFSFTPCSTSGQWKSFGSCRFIIPRIELGHVSNRWFLACNIKNPHTSFINEAGKNGVSRHDKMSLHDKETPPFAMNNTDREALAGELERLCMPVAGYSAASPGMGKILSRQNTPTYDKWKKNITREVNQIKEGRYHKVVLARKVDLLFDHPQEPLAYLAGLKKLPAKRYDFLFLTADGCAFLGSSPERLYKREGKTIKSEAIAGTRRRGRGDLEDENLAGDLLDSDKERREHDFVMDTVKRQLAPLCSTLKGDDHKRLLKLKEGQHMVSYLEGILKEAVTDDLLVSTLHPTPAVGGCPLPEALNVIAKCEPFERGWYSGVIGAVGFDSCDFTVGLRSGLIEGNRLSLFSGVGVVDGSDAHEEWNEVDCKIANFLDIASQTK